MEKIIASSLDNFITVTAPSATTLPYVTFTFSDPLAPAVTITIENANDSTSYRKELVGTTNGATTSASWCTSGKAIYSLYECLRKNSIFYNITIENANTIKAFIDSNITYTIVASNTSVSIGGNFFNYTSNALTKSVIMLQGTIGDEQAIINLEKNHIKQTVSFNISSPFSTMTSKVPVSFDVNGYALVNGIPRDLNFGFDSVVVMPTTLSKFDYVDYNDYFYVNDSHYTPKKWLTNNTVRDYNYDEVVGLSFLTNADIVAYKSYYSKDDELLYTEAHHLLRNVNNYRTDIYFKLAVEEVEITSGKQVGYVLVDAMNLGVHVSNSIRFNIMPKCSDNNEIFFLNELGGIDSFNFLGKRVDDYSIKEASTYFANHVKEYDDEFEMEKISTKKHQHSIKLSSTMLDYETAKWLNEMAKSKYVFEFDNIIPHFLDIVIDKFDIDVNSEDDEYEVEMTYHKADNKVNF